MGAGGVSPPYPKIPSRAERRLRDDGQRRRWRLRLRFALRLPEIRFCGVRASPACDMPMFFTHRSGAAAFSRPDMPHTLRSPPGEIPKSCPRRHSRTLAPCGALGTFWKPCASGLPCGFAVLTPARIVVVVFALAATAPPFTATQGLASATGTRALPPRDPGFPSFHVKRSKTRKAAVFMKQKIRCAEADNRATAILRYKPSMRHSFGRLGSG